jgi:hypothetical protein
MQFKSVQVCSSTVEAGQHTAAAAAAAARDKKIASCHLPSPAKRSVFGSSKVMVMTSGWSSALSVMMSSLPAGQRKCGQTLAGQHT